MFKSLVSGAKRLAIGESGAAPISQLFPKVDPKVDGEDCLRDCETCTTHYPRGFKIEGGDDLYGGIKGWSTHVLVATGKADWTHNVADEKGSVMQAFDKADKPSNGVRNKGKKEKEKSHAPACSGLSASCLLPPAFCLLPSAHETRREQTRRD